MKVRGRCVFRGVKFALTKRAECTGFKPCLLAFSRRDQASGSFFRKICEPGKKVKSFFTAGLIESVFSFS